MEAHPAGTRKQSSDNDPVQVVRSHTGLQPRFAAVVRR